MSAFPHTAFFRQTGTTPLAPVHLRGDASPIWCKLEFLNPSGSTKDRIAGYILSKAWRSGKIAAGATVIEASSGSTSIAFAMVCAQMGLRFIAVMPQGVSEERAMIVRGYGGEVEWSPKEAGISGAMRRAQQLAGERNAFYPRQFENPDNAAAHRFGTAVELFKQIPDGKVDAIVSGVGTGGTLVGLVQGCEDHGCRVTAVAARPVLTSTRSGFVDGECCSFSLRIPGVVDKLSKIFCPSQMSNLIEIDVDDEVALATTRELMALGFPVGPSSGLNFAAALEWRRRVDPSATIVTVFPDRMERYFSTDLFAPWRAGVHA
jgi:cysteine synthase A